MRLAVYETPDGTEPILWLGESTAEVYDVLGNPITPEALAMAAAHSPTEDVLYADVPVSFIVAARGVKLLISPRPAVREARAAFLAGEGTLTVEEVRVWARDLGNAYELDGCKDPTPKLMVAAIDETGREPRLVPGGFVQ